MGLESLEFVKRRQVRIAIVEMNDEAGRNQILAIVVDERTAPRERIERPALAMPYQSLAVLRRRNLPKLLDADSVFLRIDAITQIESVHQLLR